jgi:hypothetical protein
MTTPKTWRTLSTNGNTGFVVWDVMEADAPSASHPDLAKQLHETGDGEYIYIQAYHFWTRKAAEEFISDGSLVFDEEIIIIPERVLLIHQAYGELTHSLCGGDLFTHVTASWIYEEVTCPKCKQAWNERVMH